jgi:hypothetical protein
MRESLFGSGDWPLSWPGGSSRIIEARPLAIPFDVASWHSGLPNAELNAYRDTGQLPVITLGTGVELVLIRDLDNLLSQLARGEEPHPEPHPRLPRSRRKRPKIEAGESAPSGASA